jgi:hypothetical protein
MAGVYLTSANNAAIAGDWWTNLFRLKQSALACTAPKHHIVATPEESFFGFFIEYPSRRSQSYVEQAFREKVLTYNVGDRVLPLVPGLYTCAEKRWYDPSYTRAGFYLKVIDHEWIKPSPTEERPRYLFSFCGSFDTHPLRRQLAGLAGHRGFIKDTSKDEGRGFGKPKEIYQEWQAEYAQILRDSMFVLCPRGVAPSNYRIFEAMKAGRVPVIIADQWVSPAGVDWAEFSLRVPEKRLMDVPEILEEVSDRAAEMGLRAAQAWERWFSKEQAFHTIVHGALKL